MSTAPATNRTQPSALNQPIEMAKCRPASPSPRKSLESSPKTPNPVKCFSNSRRSGLRPVPHANAGSLFSLHLESKPQGHQRNWSSGSSDSNSSSDGELLSSVVPKEVVRGKYSRDFGFLTPATSPQSSLNGYSDPVSIQSSMVFLDLPTEVSKLRSMNTLASRR